MISKLTQRMKEKRLMRRASRDVAHAISGQLSAHAIRRAEKQSGDNAAYQEEYLLNAHILADLAVLRDDPDIQAIMDSGVKHPTTRGAEISRRQRTAYWPALAVAATLVLAMGITWFVTYDPPVKAQSLRYITRVGEIKTVNLPDGSQVTLNTDTQLMVSYSDSFRDLALLKGEVFFDVSSDPSRPFSIALGSRDVTVLGTQFNIRKSTGKFTLAVMEGMVSLHPSGEAVSDKAALLSVDGGEVLRISQSGQRRLSANTVVEFDENRKELVAYYDPKINSIKSWQQGYLRFVEAPLDKVVAELNRYSSKPITIVDSEVADYRITATLRLDQLNKTLDGIELSLPITLVRNFDNIEIIKQKNK